MEKRSCASRPTVTFLLLLVLASCGEGKKQAEPHWTSIVRGTLAEVHMEQALYQHWEDGRFLCHFRITNLAKREIAADFSDYWRVIRPNQWGPSDGPHRQLIDEERVIKDPLDTEMKARIRNRFERGDLVHLQPGMSVDYYREFNGDSHQVVNEKVAGYRYCILSLDGSVSVTDGVMIEEVGRKEHEIGNG